MPTVLVNVKDDLGSEISESKIKQGKKSPKEKIISVLRIERIHK